MSEFKKFDQGKWDPTLLEPIILRAIARVSQYGATKYGRDNWRLGTIDRYHRAMLRHALETLQNPMEIDDETLLPHLAHIAWNCMAILWLDQQAQGKQVTDEEFTKAYGELYDVFAERPDKGATQFVPFTKQDPPVGVAVKLYCSDKERFENCLFRFKPDWYMEQSLGDSWEDCQLDKRFCYDNGFYWVLA